MRISDEKRREVAAELREASTGAYRHVDALDVIAGSVGVDAEGKLSSEIEKETYAALADLIDQKTCLGIRVERFDSPQNPTCAAAGCTNYEKEAAMAVEVGTVQTFPGARPDKAQALKVLEEAAEVFGAWQLWDDLDPGEKDDGFSAGCLMGECADVIQATCNLLAAYGVTDFTGFMDGCRKRNEQGRLEP